MTYTTDAAPAGAALSVHSDDPDIRILRRVTALKDFPLAPPTDGPVRFVTIVDTETTGTDPMHDEIIDIAVVTLEVDAAGEIVGILSSGQALRDPRMPIPPYITKLTGITDADVCGRVIDLDRLEHRLSKADVLIAHNAMFDIAFIENLMPGIAGAAWACSANDFDWLEAKLDGRKLGHLLMQIGRFNDAHRAMADVVSLIHLLAHRLPHGGTLIGDLLANAEKPTVRLEATGASFDRLRRGATAGMRARRSGGARLPRKSALARNAGSVSISRRTGLCRGCCRSPGISGTAEIWRRAAARRFLPEPMNERPGLGKNAPAMTAVT